MLRPGDSFLLLLILLPGGMVASFRLLLRYRPALAVRYRAVQNIANLLLLGPLVYVAMVMFEGHETDPEAVASALGKIEQFNTDKKPDRLPAWLQWLQTHPPMAERIAKVRAL